MIQEYLPDNISNFVLFAFRSLLQIQDLPRHDLLSQDLGDSLYGAPDTSPQATSLDWSDLSLLLIFLQYPGKLDNKQSLVFCNLLIIINGNCRSSCTKIGLLCKLRVEKAFFL